VKKKIFSICLSVVVLVSLIAVLVPGCTGGGDTYELTMAANPAAGGTATDETGGSPYEEGADVDIKAVPADCYRFVNWSAPAGTFGNSTAAETTFTMPARDVTVTANFEAITLGHFKFYDVDDTSTPPPIGTEVQLEDQFGAITAMVQEAIVFGNAADKVHDDVLTPMSDPDHHLTLYRLEYEDDTPQYWVVGVKNQFGDNQELTVTGPSWLAVPTTKAGHEEPVCLDHFLVYDVVPQTYEPVEVELNDQFTQETVTVYEPYFFANPVKKTVGSEVTKIQNPDDHLVFYWIEGESYETSVQFDNQFGDEQTLALTDPVLMAVPSEKISFMKALDHFKGYVAEDETGLPIEEVVSLEDQFGTVNAMVGFAQFFFNPAAKLHGDVETLILNPDHHFTVYNLFCEGDPQTWQVGVTNQFGEDQVLTVEGPVALAVPTQKLVPGDHEPPVGLDHYLLYAVTDSLPMEVEVSLQDQFGVEPEPATVYAPTLFANPVKKTLGGEVTEIVNPEAHLVFYPINSAGLYPTPVLVSNQFRDEKVQTLNLYGPALLGVPSGKLFFNPID